MIDVNVVVYCIISSGCYYVDGGSNSGRSTSYSRIEGEEAFFTNFVILVPKFIDRIIDFIVIIIGLL